MRWFAGLLLSIPLSIYSSSTELGRVTRKLGLFVTPQESRPPRVIELLRENLLQAAGQPVEGYRGAKRVVVQPAVHALHLALLPERPLSKRHRYYLRTLIYQLVEDGPDSLSSTEHRSLPSDPETLCLLHMLWLGGWRRSIPRPDNPASWGPDQTLCRGYFLV